MTSDNYKISRYQLVIMSYIIDKKTYIWRLYTTKMIKRKLEEIIFNKLFTGKTIVVLGARQVGKTTLLRQISESLTKKIIWLNADNPEDRTLLEKINSTRAKEIFPKGTMVFIDEAQRIENTGLSLKIIHDSCKDIQLIVTGSSSFELTDRLKESMTGRKWTYKLYPVSFQEIFQHYGIVQVLSNLEQRLIYGSYPEVLNHPGNEKEILMELISDYLYKDIFALKEIRKPDAIENLLKALALQVGNQVSFRELSQLVQIDKQTIERYILMLEEAFIIFRLGSFSRNLRNELKYSKKIYFVDLGVRNALLNKFSPLNLREDTGALWENYLIAERRKKIEYNRLFYNTYFWRTTRQQEIDYIEEHDGQLDTYEFKWNKNAKSRLPKSFSTAYANTNFKLITPENYMDFIG